MVSKYRVDVAAYVLVEFKVSSHHDVNLIGRGHFVNVSFDLVEPTTQRNPCEIVS